MHVRYSTIAVLFVLFSCTPARTADSTLLDAMEAIRFRPPAAKGKAALVEGKVGKAVRFSFDKDCASAFFTSNLRGTPAWDRAAGFSFWVKGDGSDHLGGLQFIYNDDYALRYDYAFPLKNMEWTKVTVAWRDLIPVLPAKGARFLDPTGENKPSKLTALWVGKWWYWRDYAAHSFALDELRLEPAIALDTTNYKPADPPLLRVLEKLKAGKPITVVTMGDSLTDYQHWANRQTSWPRLLQKRLKEKYQSEATILNPAIGGTMLRQNLVLMPGWLAKTPEPDLVTVCFGANDWDSGMRGPMFYESNRDAIDRIRRATKGKADVLLLTTIPGVANWTTRTELAEACRKAARERNAGLADTERAFLTAGNTDKERLFAWDKTHLGTAGHELVAQTILETLEKGGR